MSDVEHGMSITEEQEAYRCPHEKDVGRSSMCYPAHRCDLNEGHVGPHECDCGKQFRKSTNLGDE